jgi:hypothetical protein
MNVGERLAEIEEHMRSLRDVMGEGESSFIGFGLARMSLVVSTKLENLLHSPGAVEDKVLLLGSYDKEADLWTNNALMIEQVQKWVDAVEKAAGEFYNSPDRVPNISPYKY